MVPRFFEIKLNRFSFFPLPGLVKGKKNVTLAHKQNNFCSVFVPRSVSSLLLLLQKCAIFSSEHCSKMYTLEAILGIDTWIRFGR